MDYLIPTISLSFLFIAIILDFWILPSFHVCVKITKKIKTTERERQFIPERRKLRIKNKCNETSEQQAYINYTLNMGM